MNTPEHFQCYRCGALVWGRPEVDPLCGNCRKAVRLDRETPARRGRLARFFDWLLGRQS